MRAPKNEAGIPRTGANAYFCDNEYLKNCNRCSDGSICFDVGEKHNITGGEGECQVVHIYVFGLEEGQELEVQREFKDPCDPLWGPWLTCGKRTILTCDCPETMLVVPGRYRVHVENIEPPLDPEHVRIHATNMSTKFAQLRLQQQCCC